MRLLVLLLTGAAVLSAGAQDQPSSVTPSSGASSLVPKTGGDFAGTNTAPSETFKLFAGISHKEVLPQAHAAIQPHLDKQLKSSIAIAAPIHQPPASIDVASRPAVLSAQTAATQNYIPAFGVARLVAERNPDPPRPVQHYTVEWFLIPNWMAGVWLKNGDMTTRVTDLQTGVSSAQSEWTPNRLEATWGHQQDAQGNYWHVNLLPSERDGSSAGKLVRFLTVAQNVESSSPQQLLTRTHYVVSESNPWNNQPIDTFQQESINHYALTPQGQLINSSSNRVFSYQGAPVREGQLVSQFAKIGQFQPVASLNGIDLRASLDDYLQSHSLGHLRK